MCLEVESEGQTNLKHPVLCKKNWPYATLHSQCVCIGCVCFTITEVQFRSESPIPDFALCGKKYSEKSASCTQSSVCEWPCLIKSSISF